MKEENKDINEDKKIKKYPSQVKYEKNNPTITVRMKLHEKEKIKEMAKKADKQISDFIRMALLNLEKDFSAAFTKAKNEGYLEGINEWAIWWICNRCGEKLFISPNSDVHHEILEKMIDRFRHENCPGK